MFTLKEKRLTDVQMFLKYIQLFPFTCTFIIYDL